MKAACNGDAMPSIARTVEQFEQEILEVDELLEESTTLQQSLRLNMLRKQLEVSLMELRDLAYG